VGIYPWRVVLLGGSGIEVSRLLLGCGNFGGIGSSPAFFGRGETQEQAFALMDAAWEGGLTTFDTADAYGGGRSEEYIGAWLRTKGPEVRDTIVLSTKTFNPMDDGEDHGLAPARIKRQLESSLTRLGVERVAMYLAHDWDPDVPVAETLGAFDELVRTGKVGAVGASNVDGPQLRSALEASERDGLVRYEWVQNSYSLLDREAEREVLPLCAEHGLGFTPFSPLAGGWLTGKYRRGEPAPDGSRMTMRPEPYHHLVDDDAVWNGLEGLARLAEARGTTSATLALAWLLAEPRLTGLVTGSRGPEQLSEPLAALATPLSAEDQAELTELFGGTLSA
jgi:aryl-alcohol dehydrogenase-like predicted oxidoreductase